jgi:hypothetical protein
MTDEFMTDEFMTDEFMTKENITLTTIEEIIPPIISPKIIFIIPYRDRETHLEHFKKQMKIVMEDYEPNMYKYMFVHQCDTREFNRGAMKNLGFIIASQLYPKDYKNITFVFNDIDTTPVRKNMLNYITTPNVIKHFYGFKYTLGGIVSILGQDFERIGGFPNFWGWGYEDNLLQIRAFNAGIVINRDVFYETNDNNVNIINFSHGTERKMNKYDFTEFKKQTKNGLYTIYELNYNIDNTTDFINITHFKTPYEEVKLSSFVHDLKNGNKPLNKRGKTTTMQMQFL